jgi:hypothetical protein
MPARHAKDARGSELPLPERVIEPDLGPDWPADGFGPIARIAELLPEAAEMATSGWIAVTAGTKPKRTLATLFRKAPEAHVSVRCAALLAKGFVDVGAHEDDGGRRIAVGRAPAKK